LCNYGTASIKINKLTIGFKKNAGRNINGKIVIRGRGVGKKTNFISLDFKRS
jgi:ribosomal protein L2